MREDEIVDLVIAAESLYLGEIGPPHERGELQYRLANRAASFTDGTASSQRQIVTFMRNAYRARNAIVHSGEVDVSKLRTIEGKPASPDQLADDLEDVLRAALKKAAHLIASGKGFPPDWDALMFPSPDDRDPSADTDPEATPPATSGA